MLQRKEEELVKRQAVERRALPKRIRAERKARDMMFRESLRISTNLDPDGEREKLKKVNDLFETTTKIHIMKLIEVLAMTFINYLLRLYSSKSKRRNVTLKNNKDLISNM